MKRIKALMKKLGFVLLRILVFLLTKIGIFEMRRDLRPNDPPFPFSIRSKGRDSFVYTEDGRSISFFAEMLMGKVDKAIYPTSINEGAPLEDSKPLSDQDQSRILKNICAYFDDTGFHTESKIEIRYWRSTEGIVDLPHFVTCCLYILQ